MKTPIWLSALFLAWAAACGSSDDTVRTDTGPHGGPDAALLVDAAHGVDAAPPDARVAPDAGTVGTGPITVVSGAAATLVIGQPDFTSIAPGQSALAFNTPVGVASDGAHLWVGDEQNARVLQWNRLPAAGTPADLVIGQASFTVSVPGTSQTLIHLGSRVFASPGHLFVSDPDNNRVLVYPNPPTLNGQPATLVIGQVTFSQAGSGYGAAELSEPLGVWSDDTIVIIADSYGGRVLIWNKFPLANGAAADVVLGQTGFGVAPIPDSPATASSIDGPRDVAFTAGRLYVLDSGHNRVMVWNGLPTTNNAPAAYLIGQASDSVGAANAGQGAPNAGGLDHPGALLVAQDHLFVTDSNNHRVVIWSPIPTASGGLATGVLGQASLTAANLGEPTAASMSMPRGLALMGTVLWVADQTWNRVLGFDLGG